MPLSILHPSIDDWQDTVVIRGVLDNNSLPELKTDFYQRELLPSTSRKNIRTAIENGTRLPDVVLGMRGEDFTLTPDSSSLSLLNPTFIIDGQQRIRTVMEMLGNAKFNPRLGTVVHVNTTVSFERDLFQKLNQFQVKVSPNILLRNMKEDHQLLTTLYGLTRSDKTFAMFDRVSWSQNMRRQDLLSISTILSISLGLHAHIAGGYRAANISVIVPASDRLITRIGLPTVRTNIKHFWEAIDSMWGIRRITIKGGAPYMRRGFLEVFAKVLSDHRDFWKGSSEERLEIPYVLKKKLGSFPFEDPEIQRLAAATGAARLTLYIHLVSYINSGKRTNNRLTPRKPSISFNIEETEEDETEVA